MKIISIICRYYSEAVEEILRHFKLWNDLDPPPKPTLIPEPVLVESVNGDDNFSDMIYEFF